MNPNHGGAPADTSAQGDDAFEGAALVADLWDSLRAN